MSTKVSGKILCLHGFIQSGDIFKAKSSGLRKSLKKIGLETHYLTAPIKVVPADLPVDMSEDTLKKFGADSNSKEYRGWWVKNEKQYQIDDTLEAIRNCYKEEGPFIGIIGFSQGAGLAGLITEKFHELVPENPPLKFSIFFSGFKITDNAKLEKYYDSKISVPTLHVIGELDTVVSLERSMLLHDECCEKGTATILMHPGGHFVPNARNIVDKEIAWIMNVLDNTKQDKETDKNDKTNEEEVDDILAMIDSLGKA